MWFFIVIRDYRPGDESQCQGVIEEGAMSTVNTAFFTGLTREVTFQSMILTSAIMFIFLGLPFSLCFASIPIVIVLMYIFIYVGHLYNAFEVSQEITNVPRVYMSTEYTGFWVAEVYEPMLMTGDPKQYEYVYIGENHLKMFDLNNYQKKIVGTIAVNKSRNSDSSAWIRRMCVSKRYHRKGIATNLLTEAIQFCEDKGYTIAELVTSEYHDVARELYLKKGFELKQMYHKPIVGGIITVLMYELFYKINDRKMFYKKYCKPVFE